MATTAAQMDFSQVLVALCCHLGHPSMWKVSERQNIFAFPQMFYFSQVWERVAAALWGMLGVLCALIDAPSAPYLVLLRG